MICPECGREHPAQTRFCTQCGSDLTCSKSTAAPVHTANQVWNSDIDREQNKKNSRAALIALAAAMLLVLALVVALLASAPSIGDILIGEREEGQSFTQRMDAFFQLFSDSIFGGISPEPEAYAAIPDGPDREFVELFEEYLEKDYNNDYADSRTLSDRYYEEFAALKDAQYTIGTTAVYAARMEQALDDMRKGFSLTLDLEDPSITHDILWMRGYGELCAIAEDLYTQYGILYKDRHIPEYYIWLRPILAVELEIEYDLTAQLIHVDATVPEDFSAPYLTYTNNTPYTFDITIYNDYETQTDYFYEECSFTDIAPSETVTLYLHEMPDEYENWYIDWYLDNCYYNGEDIYTYDW